MKLTFQVAGSAFAQEGGHGGQDDSPSTAPTHSETGVAHDTGEGGGVFPPFDPSTYASQLLWLAITFGACYLLMSRMVIPRIGGILETRSDRISQDLDEAQRLRDESDAAHAAYEHELAEARNRAHAIGAKARDEAKAVADERRAEIEADLARKLADAESKIADIKKRAFAEIGDIATAAADAIVRQLVGSSPARAEVARAVAKADAKGESDA